MPGLIYLGDCEWGPIGEPEPSDPPGELPTTREPWMGRADKLAAFRAAYYVGRAYLGGYIIDNTPRNAGQGAAAVDLIIVRPPVFLRSWPANSTSIKTATKSASVSASGIIEDETDLKAERTVSFYSPETRHVYFTATRPSGPAFSAMATSGEPVILRSVIKASANGKEVTFAGANAPGALVSALNMPGVTRVTAHDAQSIPGTPWYRCTDTVSRELAGDA